MIATCEHNVAVAMAALLLLTVPVAGSVGPPSPLPPLGLSGVYDEETGFVNLSWQPSLDGVYLYRVYKDGRLLNQTEETVFVDNLKPEPITGKTYAVYHVTAVDTVTLLESPPSNPVYVGKGPMCNVFNVSIFPSQGFFLEASVNESCVRWWEQRVDDLLGGI